MKTLDMNNVCTQDNNFLFVDTIAMANQHQSSEISRDNALKIFLIDESLSDVALLGSNGVRVNANKCMLAARSNAFRALLFGGFAEGKKSTVSVRRIQWKCSPSSR